MENGFMGMNILQLSDLHIGKELDEQRCLDILKRNLETLLHSIIDALDKESLNSKIDKITVTGDIFDCKVFEEREGISNYLNTFSMAVCFFENLIKNVNSKGNNNLSIEDLIVIPGNHELNRPNIKSGEAYSKPDVHFQKYREFLRLLYKGMFDRLYPEPDSNKHIVRIVLDENKNTIIIGFNSVNFYWSFQKPSKEIKHEYFSENDFGAISFEQITYVRNFLKNVKNLEKYSIVALTHHHFSQYEERTLDYHDNSAIRNEETFLKFLSDFNVKLILHGHKHQTIDRLISTTFDLSKPIRVIPAIGCGSTTAAGADKKQFNTIYDYKNKQVDFEYKEFSTENQGFELSRSFCYPPLADDKNQQDFENLLRNIEKTSIKETFFNIKKKIKKDNFDFFEEILKNVIIPLPRCVEYLQSNSNSFLTLLIAILARKNLKNKVIEEFLEDKLNSLLGDKDECDKILKWLLSSELRIIEHYQNIDFISADNSKEIIFIILGAFLADLYISINDDYVNFYRNNIQNKVNIYIDMNGISFNGGNLEIVTDLERRSLDIKIIVENADSHKVMKLIATEFSLLLSQLEEVFSYIGFKIYHITSIVRDEESNQLESYNFEAYTPTLIPLLAGKNIYLDNQHAFLRELIQNSIDAIEVRRKMDRNIPYARINIHLDEKRFFVRDTGTGMSRYLLERFFTSIGRSYYTSKDFRRLYIRDYSPVSQFGIGFLSVFLVTNHVEIFTKHYQERKYFHLDIPNNDGCFFINELSQQPNLLAESNTIYNTAVCLNFEEKQIHDKRLKLCQKMEKIFLNPPVKILMLIGRSEKVNHKEEKKDGSSPQYREIKSNSLFREIDTATDRNGLFFFFPFKSSDEGYSNEVMIDESVVQDKVNCVGNDSFFNQSNYGILLYKPDKELSTISKVQQLSAGMFIGEDDKYAWSNRLVKASKFQESSQWTDNFFDVVINYPPSLLKLNVSRDTVKNANDFIDILDNQKIRRITDIKVSNVRAIIEVVKAKIICSDKRNFCYFDLCRIFPDNYGLHELHLDVTETGLYVCRRFDNSSGKDESITKICDQLSMSLSNFSNNDLILSLKSNFEKMDHVKLDESCLASIFVLTYRVAQWSTFFANNSYKARGFQKILYDFLNIDILSDLSVLKEDANNALRDISGLQEYFGLKKKDGKIVFEKDEERQFFDFPDKSSNKDDNNIDQRKGKPKKKPSLVPAQSIITYITNNILSDIEKNDFFVQILAVMLTIMEKKLQNESKDEIIALSIYHFYPIYISMFINKNDLDQGINIKLF